MNPFDQSLESDGFHLPGNSPQYMLQSAKWGRFLAIVGYVCIGICLLAALLMFVAGPSIEQRNYAYGRSDAFGGVSYVFIGLYYLIVGVVYFFPCLYLNRFATKMLNAIGARDVVQLELAFENMRNFFRFIGILTIVVIALTVFAIFAMFLASAANSGNFR